MHWLGLIGSLAGITLVVLAARWLGNGPARLEDEGEAMTLAREMVAGFQPVDAVRCGEGRAALLLGHGGEFVLLKRLGSHFAARLLDAPVSARLIGEHCLEVESGDRWFGRVQLTMPDAAAAEHWRARIAAGAEELR